MSRGSAQADPELIRMVSHPKRFMTKKMKRTQHGRHNEAHRSCFKKYEKRCQNGLFNIFFFSSSLRNAWVSVGSTPSTRSFCMTWLNSSGFLFRKPPQSCNLSKKVANRSGQPCLSCFQARLSTTARLRHPSLDPLGQGACEDGLWRGNIGGVA